MNVLIMGATSRTDRYAYLALKKLQAHQHTVFGIGLKEETVDGVEIKKGTPPLTGIDTITLYLNPTNQKPYYDYFVQLKPRRVIFNPGTENPELEKLLQANNIATEEACTLVMLGSGQF
ncbi:MAG TPA: CoA-binding protein [Flavobacteriales bacterium]|nr:CoA-binding protein [Flavobacteriales bacterium]